MKTKEDMKNTYEVIRSYVNEVIGLELDLPRALNLIEQTLDTEIDWSNKEASQRALFDFIEKRQGEVIQ
jgi:hypothetical protein